MTILRLFAIGRRINIRTLKSKFNEADSLFTHTCLALSNANIDYLEVMP